MIPADFDYCTPASVAEALQMLTTYGSEAKLLAGGHSLLPAMRLRLARPKVIVDISRIPDLAYIRERGEYLAIGAATTHWEVERSALVAQWAPGLAECVGNIGDPQVRNRGTIGGSLAHADPAADYPAILLALDGQCVVQSSAGSRVVAAGDLFLGPYTTRLTGAEILTEVRIPRPTKGSASAYVKMARRASDFALVGAGAYVAVAGGVLAQIRVGITGVGLAAYRAGAVEAMLTGAVATPEGIRRAAAGATQGVEIADITTVPADYRMHCAQVYTVRAIEAALRRALGG